jgi:CheY-like chemotaxis protein
VTTAALSHPDAVLTESAARETAASPRKTGVLVVDDEPIVRNVLTLCLRSVGFAIWQAGDGYEALESYRVRREEIDVVLLDVRMPGLNGPRTFAALREINPEIRCCFMSGDAGEYTVGELLAAGAVGFLAKPFRVAEVEALVRQALQTQSAS